MPRYFFHIMDGTAFIDTEGVELADIAAVRRMATTTAGQMLEQIGDRFWEGKPWRLTGPPMAVMMPKRIAAPTTTGSETSPPEDHCTHESRYGRPGRSARHR